MYMYYIYHPKWFSYTYIWLYRHRPVPKYII